MVSLFLVLDIFIDMIYIAIIGLELYFYITFDEDYIDIYFFFYIAEGVVISKILAMLFYIIGLMITKSTYINIGKLYCFIISIVNVIICYAGIAKNSSWQLFVLPFGGMFVIFGSFYNDIEKLYPSMKDTMNQNQQNYNYMQKPYAPMNQNPVMNLYPSAEETQGVKEEDYNMPPPAVDNN